MPRKQPLYPSTKGKRGSGKFRITPESELERAEELLEYAEVLHHGAERLLGKIDPRYPFAKEEHKRAIDAIDALSDVIVGLRRIARGAYYTQTRR